MTGRAPLLALALLAGCDRDATVLLSAASMGDVAERVAEAERQADRPTLVSVAASSVLARQIARGAPADVYLTADPAWIDWLIEEGVPVFQRQVIAEGRLVVVGPPDAVPGPLAEVLVAPRIALADPAHVPAGRYARAALETAGLWEAVGPHVVPLGDVRAALAAVETGVLDRAIVYASDARASRRVRVVAEVPSAPVVFEAALLDVRGRSAFDALVDTAAAGWADAGFQTVRR